MAPASSGATEHLIEPARLRPNRSMSPRRDEEMTGTRVSGLPRQHRLAPGERTATRPMTAEARSLNRDDEQRN